ncbi:protein of unknown function [Burkholderia multivorans]
MKIVVFLSQSLPCGVQSPADVDPVCKFRETKRRKFSNALYPLGFYVCMKKPVLFHMEIGFEVGLWKTRRGSSREY